MREAINNPAIPLDRKLVYYEYLDIIEDIESRQVKPTEQYLKRAEKKEIERAENNAQLAYHYSRLKKYMSPGEIDKFNRMLSIGVEKKDGLFQEKE